MSEPKVEFPFDGNDYGEIKAALDFASTKLGVDWDSQACHKFAVARWFLDACGIDRDDPRRKIISDAWMTKTKGGFGSNASGTAQNCVKVPKTGKAAPDVIA